MTRLFFALLLLLLFPSVAEAQCTGKFPASTVCGNFTASPAVPGPVSLSASGVGSVTNSDSSLTFSPTTGAVVGSLNSGHSNNWTAAQTFTLNGSSIILNTPSTGQTASILFESAGTSKWNMNKGPSDEWNLNDLAGSRLVFEAVGNSYLYIFPNSNTSTARVGIGAGGGLQPQMQLSVNNTSTSGAWGADSAGHPYCDMMAMGAGTGNATNDQSAWLHATSVCSGGTIFFPCASYINTT